MNESPKVGRLLSLVGIYFRKTTRRGNLFSKRRASSKYLKIKTFRKLPAIRYHMIGFRGTFSQMASLTFKRKRGAFIFQEGASVSPPHQ